MKILRSYYARITFADQSATFPIEQEHGAIRGRLRRMSAQTIAGGIGEDISWYMNHTAFGMAAEYRTRRTQ